jgi:RNA polymerase sigma factor (sigma-70 family)
MASTGRAARDEGSFDDVYRREREPMLRVAYLIVGSIEGAEDLVHDSFVELQRRWERIDNPGAYLRRTVINRCLTWRRRQRTEQRHLDRLHTEPSIADAPEEPLWALLNTLPVRTRTALVLTFYLDLSSEVAAECLGCRPGTVRSLVHRGLETLRKEMR